MRPEKRGEYTRARRKKFLRLKRAGLYPLQKTEARKVEPIITSVIKQAGSDKIRAFSRKTMSFTYIGIIITLLSYFGIPENDATITIKTTCVVVGAIITFWGRWRKGDLNIFGIRK